MKSNVKTGNPETVGDIIRGNAIGNTDLRKNKMQAEGVLLDARLTDVEKMAKGYRWMSKEKTSRLVHPDNIVVYGADGWKFNTVVK